MVLEKAFELKALADKSLQHGNLEDLSFEEGNVQNAPRTALYEVHLTDEQSNNDGIVMYLSNGWWYMGLSKMIVIMSYLLNDKSLQLRESKASENPIQCAGNESRFQSMATHLRLG